MEYLFLMFFFVSFYCCFFFFSKKLILLLLLEMLMLLVIFFFFFFFSSMMFCFTPLILFSVFMVLDSVFGISILISSSRNSSSMNIYYNNF